MKVAILVVALLSAGSASANLLQVSTSFGSQTALLDSSSKLEWPHWNITNNYSYNDMKAQLSPGGKFEGWRYASPAELKQFFIDYTDSPNGIVRYNDRLTIQFMNNLGGPLYIATNPATGFHRETGGAMLDVPWDLGHAIYGYIATDNFYGATITPELQGSSRDWFGTSHYGHWLVKDQVASIPEPGGLTLLAAGLAFVVFTNLIRLRNR